MCVLLIAKTATATSRYPCFCPCPKRISPDGQNRLYATISKRTSITCRIRRVVRRLDSDIWLTVVWWLGRQPLPWASYLPRLPLLQAPLSVRLFFVPCCLRFLISFSFKCFRCSSKAVYYDALRFCCFYLSCCCCCCCCTAAAVVRCPRKAHEIKLNPQFIILCFFILFQFVARLVHPHSWEYNKNSPTRLGLFICSFVRAPSMGNSSIDSKLFPHVSATNLRLI